MVKLVILNKCVIKSQSVSCMWFKWFSGFYYPCELQSRSFFYWSCLLLLSYHSIDEWISCLSINKWNQLSIADWSNDCKWTEEWSLQGTLTPMVPTGDYNSLCAWQFWLSIQEKKGQLHCHGAGGANVWDVTWLTISMKSFDGLLNHIGAGPSNESHSLSMCITWKYSSCHICSHKYGQVPFFPFWKVIVEFVRKWF